MSSLSSSSKPKTSRGRVALGLAGHGWLAPSSVLEQVTRAGGRWHAFPEHPCSRDELAEQLFKTEDLLWSGWARPRWPWLQVTRAGGRRDALT